MRFEIVLAPASPPKVLGRSTVGAAASSRPPGPREKDLAAHQVLDMFIDGANVTARVRETHGAFVLADLGLALAMLAKRPRAKASVRFYDEPWELCVERFGSIACLSVYRVGADPVIAAYDRAVPFDDVVSAVRQAIERLLGESAVQARARRGLQAAADQLRAAPRAAAGASLLPELMAVIVELDRDAPLSFGAEFAMRESHPGTHLVTAGGGPAEVGSPSESETVERSDVHALLFRGLARAEIRGRAVELGECHPVLLAERLLQLARSAFDAWERGLAMHARTDAAGVMVGMRVSSDGQLALTLGPAVGNERRTAHTFPALGVADVLEAALTFGRSLVRAIVRRDRSQATNLRLGALRRSLRESTEILRHASQLDSKINPTPEPYRDFARALETRPEPTSPKASRLRYSARWRAVVPGIDLRSTYLCGGRLVVGAASEMWALDSATGKVLWRTDVPRGTSVATPAGIIRIGPDGRVLVHDVESGEPTLDTRIAPRVGGPMAGAVVQMPGLPRLVIVTEGEHHLVAIDLESGEHRWRWSWGGARGAARATPRLKRSGRLTYFTCGDGALTALDVMTGEVVWRLRDRLRFRAPPSVAHEALFAIAGGAHGVACLYCVDPYSGRVRWDRALADANAPCTVEGAPLVARSAVGILLRQKSGVSLAAFRRDDGAPIPVGPRVVAPSGSSWLAVDDVFIGNTPLGDLVAVHAPTGELTWRHVLGPRPLDADLPRRLEPVLRSGALFVPCSLVALEGKPARGSGSGAAGAAAGICIVRPSDGGLVGSIAPTEAIPDLLRVDEDCNVYVAEESGHLVSFGALPRLTLVARDTPPSP